MRAGWALPAALRGVCIPTRLLLFTLQVVSDCFAEVVPGTSVFLSSETGMSGNFEIASCRGSSQLRDGTWVSCIDRQIFLYLSHQGGPARK